MWFWKVASLGLAGGLDLAAGMLFVHVFSVLFSHPLLWWQYGIGAFLGASPDIDLLLCFFGKDPHKHHENLTHRPIVGVPFAVLLGWFLGGEFWAWAAGVSVFWHYLHDTRGFLGLNDNTGIGWCWPFSKKYWGVQDSRIVSQTLAQILVGKEAGFESIYRCYLAPTEQSVREFLLTSIFFGVVAGGIFGLYFGVVAVAVFWLLIGLLWALYRIASPASR